MVKVTRLPYAKEYVRGRIKASMSGLSKPQREAFDAKRKNPPIPELRPVQRSILKAMRAAEIKGDLEDAEIVEEKHVCYVGDRRLRYSSLLGLLRIMVIKDVSYGTEGMQRYVLNETGRQALEVVRL